MRYPEGVLDWVVGPVPEGSRRGDSAQVTGPSCPRDRCPSEVSEDLTETLDRLLFYASRTGKGGLHQSFGGFLPGLPGLPESDPLECLTCGPVRRIVPWDST